MIVFNGKEYDGVESMPDDVRREYESALGALGEADRAKVESALGHGAKFKMDVTVHRRFRIGGTEYDSVDAMPADVRAAYERALAANPSLADTTAHVAAAPPGAFEPPPPAIDAQDSRRGGVLRVAAWVVVALAVLAWLLLRR
jgi:hypothetical protein